MGSTGEGWHGEPHYLLQPSPTPEGVNIVKNALVEVLSERIRQDEMWGDRHDDGHTSQDWDRFIRCRLDDFYKDDTSWDRRRELMVHIAALALACLQADDREGLAMQA